MPDPIVINGKKFITSKQAAALTGYARDYVGQLVRMGKVKGQVIDKVLFVSQESLLEHADIKNDNAKAVENSFKSALAEQSVKVAESAVKISPESVALFPNLNKVVSVVKKEKLVSKFKKSPVPTFVAGIAPYADAIGKVTSYTLRHAIGIVAVLALLTTSYASINKPDAFLHNLNNVFSTTNKTETKNEASFLSSISTTAKNVNQKINSFFGIGNKTPETTVVLLPSKVVTATSTIIREFSTTTVVRYVQGGGNSSVVVHNVQDTSSIDALAKDVENLKNFQNGQVNKIYESVGNSFSNISIPSVSPIAELEVTSTFTLNGDSVTDLVGSGLELTNGVLSATAGSGFSTTSNDYYLSTKSSLPNLTTLQGLTNLTTINATTTTFALGSDYITDLTGWGITIVNGALTADFATSSANYNFIQNLSATTSLPNLNTLAGLSTIGSTTGTTTLLGAAIFNGNVGIGTSTPASKLTLAGGNFTHTAAGNPTIAGVYSGIFTTHDTYVSGKYAYIAGDAAGLRIVDISNPAVPSLVGTYNTTGLAYDVQVSGKYAYVADDSAGLQIIDISNPAVPSLVGTYNTPGFASGVYVSGKYAYVADSTSGLQVIDISNPAAPSLVGTYDTTGISAGIYVSGKYAYVTDYDSGLQIIDISNPAAPSLVGTYNTTGSTHKVYVSGKYAYIADEASGLQIVDISNPATPTLVGTYDTTGDSYDVHISGKYAYVADGASGLQIINISNPAAPTLVGTYDTPGFSYGVYVSGKYVYVADSSTLQIIDINGIETPSLYAGNINTNDITITENVDIGNSLSIRGGLNVGQGGIFTDGAVTAAGTSSSYFAGALGIGTTSPYQKLSVAGNVIADTFIATSTTATSTFPNLSITNLSLGSDYVTDLTGSGLSIVNGALTVDASGNWATTSDSYAFDTRLAATTTLNNLTKIGTQASFSFGSAVGSALTLTSFDCSVYSNGGKLTTDSSGVVSCANDTSGSGGGGSGSDTNWTYFNNSGISVATTTNQVVIGASATSSSQKLQVTGGVYVIGSIGIGTSSPYETLSVNGGAIFSNAVRASIFTATSTTATSTFPNLSITNLSLGSDYVTDLTGSGLSIVNGALTAAFSTTSVTYAFGALLSATTSLPNLSTLSGLASIGSTTGTTTFLGAAIFNTNIGIGTSTPSNKLTLAGGNFTHTASGNPSLLGTYDTTGNAQDVYVSGKYAYVADLSSGLQVVDISNPAAPSLVGTYDTTGTALGVYVSGKYAYIADGVSGLQVVDISNPVTPTLVGTYDTSGAAYAVYVSGKYAYVADFGSGLQIIDISNPAIPTLKGTFDTSGFSYGVYVSGKYAYVADDAAGLQIINISNPAAPTLTGTYNTSGSAQDVYVSGKYAYVADGASGLQVVDTSNPAAPSLVGTYNTPGYAYDVYTSGKYAYIADFSSGLQVIDISNPAAPNLVGAYDSSDVNEYVYGVYVSGKYAYTAVDTLGMQTIDINGIETPSLYAGNINTNDITITENVDIGNSLSIRGGLNVGQGGIFTDGAFASAATTSTSYFASGLGIGTTTPLAKLDIFNTTSSATAPLFSIASSTNGLATSTALYVAANGNIGIGTSSPVAMLHIQGVTGSANLLQLDGKNAAGPVITMANSGTIFGYMGAAAALTSGAATDLALRSQGSFYLSTGGSSARMTITSTGNVGIGTTSPYSPLSVNGTTTALLFQATSTTATSSLPLLAVTALSVNGVYTNSLWSTTSDSFSFSALLSATSSVSKLATLAGLTNIGSSSATTNVLGNLKITGTAAINGASITANTGLIVQGAADSGSSAYGVRGNAAGSNTTFAILGYDNTTACDNICNVAGLYAETNTSGGRAIVGSASGSGVAGYFVSGTGNALEAFSTDGYGLSVGSTNSQGLHVSGSTYSIYAVGGPSYFEKSISIGTPTATGKLTLAGGNFTHTAVGNPVHISDYYPAEGFDYRDAYVSGNYLYAMTGNGYLLIADISNPSSPRHISYSPSIGGDFSGHGVTVSGKYAYIAGDDLGLKIMDVSNPYAQKLIGTYNTPGNANKVYVSGKYAYVADDTSGLEIFNISNPATPTLVGSYDTSGTAYDVFVSGKYAYVADGSAGLQVIDVSNPANPTLSGVYNTPGTASDVYISGSIAYVADYFGGLQIIDITDPTTPTSLGAYTTSMTANAVSVSGKYAYVADDTGLKVFDISDPTSPSYVGATSGTAISLFISGKYAYVAGGYGSQTYIYDINGIETPSLYAGNINTNALTVSENVDIGNNLYVRSGLNVGQGGIFTDGVVTAAGTSSSYFGGNVGIGTTSPYAKLSVIGQVVGEYFTATSTTATSTFPLLSTNALSLNGGYFTSLWATSSSNYFLSATTTLNNLNTLAGLATIGSTTGTTTFNSAAIFNGNVGIGSTSPFATLSVNSVAGAASNQFVVGSSTGTSFLINNTGNIGIGTTSPRSKLTLAGGNFTHTAAGNPTLAGSYDTSGLAQGVYVSGKYAYVADNTSGLQIIDITNPASTTVVGVYDTAGAAYDVVVSGKYAYVADLGSGLQIIDVSNPTSPRLVGTYDTPGLALAIDVVGKYAYIADHSSGVEIIDISNPALPVLKGTYSPGGPQAFTVRVLGKYAYVGLVSGGMVILDISNPAAPTVVSTTGANVTAVYVAGKYAYTTGGGSAGLQIFNVSNPASPTRIGSYPFAASGQNIYVSGKYAYVGVDDAGVYVFDISNPIQPTLVGTYDTPDLARAVFVSGKYLYEADKASGLLIFDINGIETPSLYAGNINTNALTVSENTDIGNNLYVHNGITTGIGGIFTDGVLTVTGTSSSYIGGNLGVGTTSPLARLDVFSDLGGIAPLFSIASSTSGAGTTTALYVAANGNVGIGTSSPVSPLHITIPGATDWARFERAGTRVWAFTAANGNFSISDKGQTGSGAGTLSSFTFASTAGGSVGTPNSFGIASSTPWGMLSVNPIASLAGAPSFVIGSSTGTQFIVTNSGNVGIGTTSPFGLLSINPTTALGSAPSFVIGSSTGTKFIVDQSGFVGIGTSTPPNLFTIAGAASQMRIDTTGTDSRIFLSVASISSGLLNYNTTAGLSLGTTNASAAKTLTLQTNGIDKVTILNGGQVGIGTTTPTAKLDVFNTTSSITAPLFSVASSTSGAGTSTALYVAANGNVGVGSTSPWATFAINPVEGAASNQFVVGSSSATNFIINNSGNIGIGTSTPSTKLQVASSLTRYVSLLDVNATVSNIFRVDDNSAANVFTLENRDITATTDHGVDIDYRLANDTTTGAINAGTIRLAKENAWTSTASTNDSYFAFSPATDAVATERLRIVGSTGNIGIGTTTPLAKLDIYNSISSATAPLFSIASSTSGAGTSTALYVAANGNVAIGTSTATRNLQIESTTPIIRLQRTNSTGANSVIEFTGNDSIVDASISYNNRVGSALTFETGGSTNTRMTIDASGNIGIGTTTPQALLSVIGGNLEIGTTTGSTVGNITIGGARLINTYTPDVPTGASSNIFVGKNSGNYTMTGTNGQNAGFGGESLTGLTTGVNNALVGFRAGVGISSGANNAGIGGSACRTITTGSSNTCLGNSTGFGFQVPTVSFTTVIGAGAYSNRNNSMVLGGVNGDYTDVALGTTSPWAKFSIQGAVGSTTVLFDIASSTSATFATSSLFRVDSAGLIGIASSTPWRTLSLNGTAAFSGLTTAAGTPNSLCINAVTKEITENAATSCVVSDRDQKQQIQELTVSGLDAIRKIQPVTFAYNDRPDRNRIGFIAQDLQAVDDRLGDAFDKNHIARSIDIPAIMSITVKAVKELDTKVTEQASTTENKFLAVIGAKPDSADNFLINGDLTFRNKFTIKTDGPDSPTQYLTINSNTGNNLITFAGNGNIGIGTGTTTLGYKLQVQGDIAATAFVNISTLDAKTDVTYLTDDKKQDILTTLNSMKIAHYHYKTEDKDNPLRLGLIAEEAPSEVLSVGGKGVDIYKLSTFAIAAIQAQQKQIQTIDARLTLLEAKVALAASSTPAVLSKDELTASVLSGLKELFAVDKLTVGSKEKPSGITLFDEKTGMPYCLKIQNGNMATTFGECGAVIGTPVEVTLPPAQGIDEPVTSTSTATTTATTTIEIVPEPVASSTPIVVETATTTSSN